MYIVLPSGLTIGGRAQDLIITDWDDSGVAYDSTDVTFPNRPGLYPGRDRLTERTHTFTIRTGRNVRTLAHAQELADQLTAEWAAGAALPPGETFSLLIETRPDRRRRIFGRPRKITALVPDVRAQQGGIELLAEFVQTDPISYTESDEVFSISVLPEQAGGLKTPLVAPLKTVVWGGVGYRFVTNAGDAAARMTVRFIGPCKNPAVIVNGQRVAINKALAFDEQITVDGRTGKVTNQEGANVSQYLTARTRLDALQLSPGQHEVSFTAEDSTQTARAELIFASAFNNI